MSQRLIIDILDYWHPGTGRGAGVTLDSITHRNSDGLPALPGRTLRGLLRDALYRAERLGWLTEEAVAFQGLSITDALFGVRGEDGAHTTPGALRVSDATLPEEARLALNAEPGLKAGLYAQLFNTAINERGTAKAGSLRGMEVVIPMQLHATVGLMPVAQAPQHWPAMLRTALPLLRAVGAHRSRGLGRCEVYMEDPA